MSELGNLHSVLSSLVARCDIDTVAMYTSETISILWTGSEVSLLEHWNYLDKDVRSKAVSFVRLG